MPLNIEYFGLHNKNKCVVNFVIKVINIEIKGALFLYSNNNMFAFQIQ